MSICLSFNILDHLNIMNHLLQGKAVIQAIFIKVRMNFFTFRMHFLHFSQRYSRYFDLAFTNYVSPSSDLLSVQFLVNAINFESFGILPSNLNHVLIT